MLHLLKEKSKVQWKMKERRKYPVLKPQLENPVSSLADQQPPTFDFSAAMKELQEEGPANYSKKHGVHVSKDPTAEETDPNQIQSLKKKK